MVLNPAKTDWAAGAVLLIDKPYGWTSFDVIKKIRNKIKIKKVGHAGTLDPLATGLLIVCTGKKTKDIDLFQAQEKEYTGTIIIGKQTPSYDAETEVSQTADISHLGSEDLEEARKSLTGTLLQYPPAHSAIKVDGKRAYTLARAGKEVAMKGREVRISTFEITRVEGEIVHFRVVCSKGTYIRSLAHDFGQKLGVGAYLGSLQRTRIGEFHLKDAFTLDDFIATAKAHYMHIHEGIEGELPIQRAAVTIGTFDGVHVGHQQILKRVVKQAREIQGQSVVVTFWPHPRLILNPEDRSLRLINTFEEKANLLEEAGIDHLVAIPFTKSFSEMRREDFVRNILIEKLHTKRLIIGYDHRFGKGREGDFQFLKDHEIDFGFKVEEISKQEVDDIAVSSTKIRKALQEGDLRLANSYLGKPFTLSGHVIEGNRLGRTIGFPTANLFVDAPYKLIPADGVYAGTLRQKGKVYACMVNIGRRPTIGDEKHSVEVHILDFEDNLYGKKLVVSIHYRMREERKFEDLEALREQLESDKLKVKTWFLSQKRH
jgi:riboflavin kinase/FMN adenylyltransferase